MPTKLVIFDCDGVLVDSEPIVNKILSRNLTGHGFPVSPEECDALFLGTTMKVVAKSAIANGAILPSDWLSEIYGEVYRQLKRGVPIIAGVATVLEQLDNKRIPYCVASNGSIEKMKITLGHTGLLDRFKGRMFSAHEVGIAKPEPGLFLFAANSMSVEPSEAIVIEDSVNGAMAAKNAHMKCFGYAPHGSGFDLIAQGATVFQDMSELAELLKS
jgi:HAD superfamily hydrolase (TIGR01509 family)